MKIPQAVWEEYESTHKCTHPQTRSHMHKQIKNYGKVYYFFACGDSISFKTAGGMYTIPLGIALATSLYVITNICWTMYI